MPFGLLLDLMGKKKKRKRTNKKNLAKLKELRREFMERCVSPSYHAYGSF